MSIEKLELPKRLDEERIAALKALFPEIFADGVVVPGALKEALTDLVEDEDGADEHYGLMWPGKRQAKKLAVLPPTGTLSPVPGGVDEDSTKNIFIEGDNLEVLRILQKSYAGRIKMIYIDPPYNTGQDFIYKDDFKEPVEAYLRRTSQADEEGLLTSNPKSSGRYHSNWLSMIYPRLVVARRLLRQDGFIAVSIDDDEVANLKLLLGQVFGEENHVATLIWDKNRKNDAKFFSVGHEYMIVFARDKQYLTDSGVILRANKEGVDELRERFAEWRKEHNDDWVKVRQEMKNFFDSIPEDDPRKPLARFTKVDDRGPYRDDGNINWPGGGGPTYDVPHPITGRSCKKPRSGWRFPTIERFMEEYGKGNIVFGEDESTVPSIRTNLFEKAKQVMRSVHFSYAQTASDKFDAIFDGVRVFDNPKHYEDLRQLVEYLTDDDDLVMDFFAGSCTTGHAVFECNKRNNSNRRFICIQLPENIKPDGNSGLNALKLGLKDSLNNPQFLGGLS